MLLIAYSHKTLLVEYSHKTPFIEQTHTYCYKSSPSSTRNTHPHLYRTQIARTEHTPCNTNSQRVRFFSDMGPNTYNTTLISVWLMRL